MGRKKGMDMAAPDQTSVPSFDRRSPNFLKLVQDIKTAFAKKQNSLQMVMIILDNPDRYAAVKQVGDVIEGVVTQVILEKTISKNAERGMLQLVSNMLLKINGKLGGTNSHVANFTTSGPQLSQANAALAPYLKRFLELVGLTVNLSGLILVLEKFQYWHIINKCDVKWMKNVKISASGTKHEDITNWPLVMQLND